MKVIYRIGNDAVFIKKNLFVLFSLTEYTQVNNKRISCVLKQQSIDRAKTYQKYILFFQTRSPISTMCSVPYFFSKLSSCNQASLIISDAFSPIIICEKIRKNESLVDG